MIFLSPRYRLFVLELELNGLDVDEGRLELLTSGNSSSVLVSIIFVFICSVSKLGNKEGTQVVPSGYTKRL